jgi:F-type H+-transporting ATPase subunit b
MTRNATLSALLALLVLPTSALAQEETEPTPPAAAEPAEVAPAEVAAPRLQQPMIRVRQPRLVQPLQAPAVEPLEPAGDPNEIMPAQAIEPAQDDALGDEAFPEDPAADQAVQQALDDGFGDEAFGEEGGFGEEAVGADEHAAEADVHATDAGDADHGEEHAPGAPHDEEHAEAHGQNWPALILNFLLWGAIIVWLLKKPLTSFLQNRRTAVIEGLEESRRIKAEAEAKHAEYTERLAHLDEELAKLRQEMIQAGEAERDRIIAEAESRAARMRRDAQFVVDQQMKQLKADLTREAIEAAVKAAEEVLTAQTGAADQERLAKAYLGDVASSMGEKVQA